MKNPVTIRMSAKELRLLRRATKVKSTAEAVRKLLQDELERQQQAALLRKVYGSMRPADFDDCLL